MHSYKELKALTDQYYTDWKMPSAEVFIDLLSKHGIRTRTKDGELIEVTFSIPTSKLHCIVLGLRYKKRDDTYSEDLFVFERDEPIKAYYKGSLEHIFTEYKNTHKGEPNTV